MDQANEGRRPTKVVLVGVLVFIVAVILGRLLVAGGALWALFAIAVPVVIVILGRSVGWGAGLVLTVLFTVAVLGTRWLLQNNPGGWIALLLLPVVALTALLVGRVLGMLRRPPPADAAPDSGQGR
jgi:hypothetical protein